MEPKALSSNLKLYRLMDLGGGTMRMVSVENPAWHSLYDGEWVRWDEVRAALLPQHPETPTDLGPREPNNDMVICPSCTCQFVAVPVNVQRLLREQQAIPAPPPPPPPPPMRYIKEGVRVVGYDEPEAQAIRSALKTSGDPS